NQESRLPPGSDFRRWVWITIAPFVTPLEWLQWVLIPRMHDLLDNKQPLPCAFAVAPYYEMALATDHPQRALILAELEKLDALFADDAS
ncbi:YqcC family protein, partial [Escherichia coli]|uniref:YqcC family protein n=1 Tax=Escherichia coli TaxID=562 RepID=UPI002AF6C326